MSNRAVASARALLFGCLSALAAFAGAEAATYVDPPVLASSGGQLSVLLVAAEHTQPGLTGPTGTSYAGVKFWTYQVCLLPNPTLLKAPAVPTCPAGSTVYNNLGSVRFALSVGDTFRIRLVNQLPKLNGADLTHYADYPPLALNPTNIHTHGFIVDPHNAHNSPTDPYGDFVLLELPPANVTYTSSNPHGTIINDGNNYVDYLYVLEPGHPTGLFWLHPHLHGISLNQVSAGLGEIMTVGTAADYCLPTDTTCTDAIKAANKRHLVLKDTQILGSGALKTQAEPTFCGVVTAAANNLGSCKQTAASAAGAAPGTWLHTVSGQVYPTINVGADGDVWEIVNGSANRDYWLALGDPTGAAAAKTTPVQVLSIDGVTINIANGAASAAVAALITNQLETVACPGSTVTYNQPVCATRIRMMPSSRVAVRVIRNDGSTSLLNLKLYTALYNTGHADYSTGDQWPAIGLAAVTLPAKTATAVTAVATQDVTSSIVGATGQLQAAPVTRLAGTTTLTTVASQPAGVTAQVAVASCPAVPVGGHRRIKFGFPTDSTFGLGIEVVDAAGAVVSSTPIQQFDINRIDVCVPISKNGQSYEVWELQNYTPEDHNFHIHQTKFFVVAGAVTPGYSIPQLLNGNVVLHDNVPMPQSSQTGCTGVVTPSHPAGTPQPPPSLCAPTSTWVVIPFHEVGDFVFHCHILEHEDGGMMSRIHVQATLP